jgi:hypothetical protein
VKIGNEPGARPQSGLNNADVVFEEPIEGGISRLLAIYQCHDAGQVGPVRSTRSVDVELLPMLGRPAFAYAGGTHPEQALVRRAGVINLNFFILPAGYYRTSARSAPDNLFTRTTFWWRYTHGAPPAQRLFAYSVTAPPGGRPVSQILVRYSSAYSSGWRWSHRSWDWYVNGEQAHLADGAPVTTTNVVVLYVNTRRGPYREDVNGAHNVQVDVTGSGRALVLRDGLIYRSVTWRRPDLTAPFTVSVGGQNLSLAPGRSWVALIPATAAVTAR